MLAGWSYSYPHHCVAPEGGRAPCNHVVTETRAGFAWASYHGVTGSGCNDARPRLILEFPMEARLDYPKAIPQAVKMMLEFEA